MLGIRENHPNQFPLKVISHSNPLNIENRSEQV
jgi:hypothetical protein